MGAGSNLVFFRNFLEVVNFTVIDHHIPAIGGEKGLVSCRRKVNNAQSPMPQPNTRCFIIIIPVSIWPAMTQYVGHSLQLLAIEFLRNKPCYSTHIISLLL